jgi:hypothetical protein
MMVANVGDVSVAYLELGASEAYRWLERLGTHVLASTVSIVLVLLHDQNRVSCPQMVCSARPGQE